MRTTAWLMSMPNEDGSHSKFLLSTLSESEDECWERELVKEINADIADKSRSPSDPFPRYWRQRNHMTLHGWKAIKVAIQAIEKDQP